MAISMAGIDHTRAGLDVRSVFSFTRKRLVETYGALKAVPGLSGCVILSTCNRMEFWLSTAREAELDPVELLCALLGVDAETYRPYFILRREREAADHLFRLAAGMESRIVGEDQILTQVGEALDLARGAYASDSTLEVLFRLAVTGGKRVKTETRLSTADQSVIHAALKALETEGISVQGKTCMVIGNGMMGRISAQALLDAGAAVTVTVRQYRSGVVDIPRGCSRIMYADRLGFLPGCDLVVSATSSPNYTLRLEELLPLQVDHTIPLIDLAVPRDIDPAAASLPWTRLYDVDSFRIDLRSDKLREELRKAEDILLQEEEHFFTWYDGADLVPQISRVKAGAGADVAARLTPAFRRAPLDDAHRRDLTSQVEGAAERMMNRLLFGLRDRLPEKELRLCLDAMEQILNE